MLLTRFHGFADLFLCITDVRDSVAVTHCLSVCTLSALTLVHRLRRRDLSDIDIRHYLDYVRSVTVALTQSVTVSRSTLASAECRVGFLPEEIGFFRTFGRNWKKGVFSTFFHFFRKKPGRKWKKPQSVSFVP